MRLRREGLRSARSFGHPGGKGRWVELIEFEVCHPAPGAPGHSNAIPGRYVRVGCVLVNLGCTAGCKDDEFCPHGFHRLPVAVPDVGTKNPVGFVTADFGVGYQVDSRVALQHCDVRVGVGVFLQGSLHCHAGCVCRMENTPVAVTTLRVRW